MTIKISKSRGGFEVRVVGDAVNCKKGECNCDTDTLESCLNALIACCKETDCCKDGLSVTQECVNRVLAHISESGCLTKIVASCC